MSVKTKYELPILLNEQTQTIIRRSEKERSTSILDWLESIDRYPKWYMKTSLENEYGGCGTLFSFQQLPEYVLDSNIPHAPRILGGQDFFSFPRKGALWNAFPTSFYAMPLIETYSDGTTYTNSLSDIFLDLKENTFQTPKAPLCFNRYDIPSKESWCESLSSCIAEMKRKEYDKIVLARAARFGFSSIISPIAVAKHLLQKTVNSVVFMVALSKEVAFVGATPEYLFQQQYDMIQTHAIAGTRRRGTTLEQDIELEKELLASLKEQSEFSYVYKDIEQVLSPYCIQLNQTPRSDVIKTSSVQHLVRSFSGTLKPFISSKALLSALHPTPAVGGFPREKVLKKIYALESFDRGWYAAPFGYVTNNESKIVVAIRSALITHNQLIAFAGTGIVESSDPHLEWEELNNKISQFTQWIG